MHTDSRSEPVRPEPARPEPARSEPTGTPRQRLWGGVLTGFGLASASFALAVTFGASARTLGWGTVPTIVCSLVLFSGSAQFALATALAGGGGAVPAVVAAALINARFIPMALSVAPSLKGGMLRRALAGQAVVDGSWIAAHLGGGRFDEQRMIGATLPQWPAWVGGTALGALLHPSPHIVQGFALDVIFPAFFLVLLIDELKESPPARQAAALAAVLAAVLVLILPVGIALLCAATAALIGLVNNPDAKKDKPEEPATVPPGDDRP
jgi:predicted branched-subunit amino acid permease